MTKGSRMSRSWSAMRPEEAIKIQDEFPPLGEGERAGRPQVRMTIMQKNICGSLKAFAVDSGSIAKETLPGPGPDAFKALLALDTFTYLVSPGVYDCAILTVYYPQQAPAPLIIGRHRKPGFWSKVGFRFMAHFNPFSGPRKDTFRDFFAEVGQKVDLNILTISIAYNELAKRPYTDQLIKLLSDAAPAIPSVDVYGFAGKPATDSRLTPPVSIYMAPNGNLFGSSP
jgi:hypothetical protein